MNIQELLGFVEQIVEPNVAKQIMQIVQDGADTYVEPVCKIVAKTCATMHCDLVAEGFTREEAVRIVIAMAGKGQSK